jgi:hypothetical protein
MSLIEQPPHKSEPADDGCGDEVVGTANVG